MDGFVAARDDVVPIGIGYYTVAEAARLLEMPARAITRWLGGHGVREGANRSAMVPLWTPQLPRVNGHIELGFRDLIELRLVRAFVAAGFGLPTVRRGQAHARERVNDPWPFSTRHFRSDGQSIFLEALNGSQEKALPDTRKRPYVLGKVIENAFKDLDLDDVAAARWRPYKGKATIVIDPARSFGQPIMVESGVPTASLADAVSAEGSVDRVARLYEVPQQVVRDAVQFEKRLRAA